MNASEIASSVQPSHGGYPIWQFGIKTATFLSWPQEFQKEIIDLQNSSNRILMAKVFREATDTIVQRFRN